MTAGSPDRHEGLRRAIAAASPGTTAPDKPTIRFVADLVCPWCYIAFRRLRRLLVEAPTGLIWHPFLLNPHLPAGGVSRTLYLERKFGSLAQAHIVHRRMTQAGTGAGIAFAFGAIRMQPNTVAAHALLLSVAEQDRQLELAEMLFGAFFSSGANLGDEAFLRSMAARVGIGATACNAALAATSRERIARYHGQAYDSGISGVPVSVFGEDHVIAGAQPVEALAALLDLERYRCGGSPMAALTAATAHSPR